MLQGIVLSLLAGPVAPAPVPAAVIEALENVRISSGARERSGFQLTFSLPKQSRWESLFLVAGGTNVPFVRVVLTVAVNGVAEVLCDGFVTHHEATPGAAGGAPTLTILGEDISVAMDQAELNGLPFPSMSCEARAATILLKYAPLGVVPRVVPTVFPDTPNLLERVAAQRGTDLAYLTEMAGACGYVFYVEPGPRAGMNVGYWGPELRIGPPQPSLNVDLQAATNVESYSLRFDANQAERPAVLIRPVGSPIPIPVPLPDVDLVSPPLGLVSSRPGRIRALAETAKMSLPQALMHGLSRQAEAAECVTVTGTLDVVRYGRLLKARRLVGLRGAGAAFDGLYYVNRVTHEIERGRYRQQFELSRSALFSTVTKAPA